MSGHSKWATTKHKKAAADSKRGKIFTKIIREITVAAKMGGGDPEGNPRLRTAILKAKENNMPADNIKKAVQKGTGELPGVTYEEMTYEGYGPGGVAIIIQIMSDNKNRTVSEIRHLLSKNGGNMGESGSVSWMFQKKGYLSIEKQKTDEEKLMSVALDAGAEDIRSDDPTLFEVITAPADFEKVKKAMTDAGLAPSYAEVTFLPQTYIRLDGKEAEQMLRLMEALEDHDDVQNVYANFDIPDEVMAKVAG
ncbi:MAG: YebC/PmpR family DNA-binding transcriptional regulator [Candidatus Manganitrophus sp.]|nr:YebC/PmpR family DNA-binding transcriptional regulator [Candidatus Manganitrophus sp.]MDC4227533.1 YebC/PmpR family DNA-binding transcriptional regulator [Candidatus Manganitrophus sp.]WDT70663.1 MAG: YebC/PmpR family DNA-binding transcriptional regulator [Candidatus Manganitrophus sp.]WDT77081.1 MAG: YebC/PmpR family DNA-binding transcriptional regulator [Candidatus Manganitrophus sp.]WDT82075.1 MAG: YebC/PmpR family DNA-binding transcriptional regulator [Candidatus Manganitrophus sp.]